MTCCISTRPCSDPPLRLVDLEQVSIGGVHDYGSRPDAFAEEIRLAERFANSSSVGAGTSARRAGRLLIIAARFSLRHCSST